MQEGVSGAGVYCPLRSWLQQQRRLPFRTAFEFVSAKRLEIKTTTGKPKHNGILVAERLERYCAQSYGKYLNFLRHVKELTDNEIINQLTKGLNPWDIPDSINQACISPPNQMELTP